MLLLLLLLAVLVVVVVAKHSRRAWLAGYALPACLCAWIEWLDRWMDKLCGL